MASNTRADTDRVSITIRMPRGQRDEWWSIYYRTVDQHRLSFNAWIIEAIQYSVTDISVAIQYSVTDINVRRVDS